MNQMIENKQPWSNRQILTNSKLKYEQSEFAFNKQRNACGTRHFTAILPTELWTHVSYSWIILGAKAYLPVQMNV